jgi:hypothetical protein
MVILEFGRTRRRSARKWSKSPTLYPELPATTIPKFSTGFVFFASLPLCAFALNSSPVRRGWQFNPKTAACARLRLYSHAPAHAFNSLAHD